MRNEGAAPVATISKGEPPPESEFDSWLFPFGALLGSVGGTAPVGSAVLVELEDVAVDALGSTVGPEDDAPEDWAVLDGAASVVVTVADVLVLVCSVVRAVDEELELVVACLLLGQSALIPISFWKTPMMDVSPTSTPAHPVLTAAAIFASPAKHPELQVAPSMKSEATQASILVL